MKYIDVIVIGGGAAGLMAAAGAAQKGASVIVLEKMTRPGRKIMITGKGRCNFTNVKAWNEFQAHIHPKPNFLKPSFYNLNSEKMIEFLTEQGMESVVERGDRAFPASHLASDVVDALVRAAENSGAEIHCNKEVKCLVTEEKELSSFTIECKDGSSYQCKRLIICTGGLSYPKTGSTGDGYGWAAQFGHTLKPMFPSLTAIVPCRYKVSGATDISLSTRLEKSPQTKQMTGGSASVPSFGLPIQGKNHIDRSTPLSEIGKMLCGNELKNIQLSVFIDGNPAQEEFGDLQFTDGGIEGAVGFKVSRKCVNALVNGSKVTAVLDLKPAVEIEDLTVRISTLWNEISKDRKNANKQYKDRYKILLTKVMPMSLIPGFVQLNPNTDHKTLAKALKNWKFEIEGYVGYERCVITAGGVSCEEVAPKTLESKLTPGLYFAGEILDLDADTGGYNLQTAFSTGYLAGINAAKSL